jgi:hypothetical protein
MCADFLQKSDFLKRLEKSFSSRLFCINYLLKLQNQQNLLSFQLKEFS